MNIRSRTLWVPSWMRVAVVISWVNPSDLAVLCNLPSKALTGELSGVVYLVITNSYLH